MVKELKTGEFRKKLKETLAQSDDETIVVLRPHGKKSVIISEELFKRLVGEDFEEKEEEEEEFTI